MPRGTPREKNETHAWCCGCEQMLAHGDFGQGQARCRPCQRARARDRYSKGRTCSTCLTAPISDYAPRENCRKCAARIRSESIAPRREVGPKRYVVISGHHGHPNADTRGRIYEHVMVMSESLGRPLALGENVHHINGVRDDNRIENLELWSHSQPKGQRVVDKVAWAKELLEQYEPDALAECMSVVRGV